MNAYPDRTLRSKLAEMSKEDLIEVASRSLLHLSNILCTKNNFSVETMDILARAGKTLPKRPLDVERMHKAAFEFLYKVKT